MRYILNSILIAVTFPQLLFAGSRNSTPIQTPPGWPSKSIHQVEDESRTGQYIHAPDTETESQSFSKKYAGLNKIVYGFLPYWQRNAMPHFQWDLLTHVADFSVSINADGSLSNPNSLPTPGFISTALSNQVMPVVCITCFNSSTINSVVNGSRDSAINNITNFIISNGYQGVNIDFEGVPGICFDPFRDFMLALAEAIYTQNSAFHVTACGPAVDWSNAYDYLQIANGTNGWMVMAYDYHYSGSTNTGPVSPLNSSTKWGTYSVEWTVNNYLHQEVPAEKIILGFPWYGYDWPCINENPNSATTGRATARTYDAAQIWVNGEGPYAVSNSFDSSSSTPWYFYYTGSTWRQTWFDDTISLEKKYDLVNGLNLGGVGMWALGYNGARSDLWDVIRKKFYSTTPTVAWKIIKNKQQNPVRILFANSRQDLLQYDLLGREARKVDFSKNSGVVILKLPGKMGDTDLHLTNSEGR